MKPNRKRLYFLAERKEGANKSKVDSWLENKNAEIVAELLLDDLQRCRSAFSSVQSSLMNMDSRLKDEKEKVTKLTIALQLAQLRISETEGLVNNSDRNSNISTRPSDRYPDQ